MILEFHFNFIVGGSAGVPPPNGGKGVPPPNGGNYVLVGGGVPPPNGGV